MNRKNSRILIPAVIALLLALVLVGLWVLHSRFARIGGELYSYQSAQVNLAGKSLPELETLEKFQSAKQMDLRGTGILPYQAETLQKMLPGCEILWDLQLDGQFYPLDSVSVTVAELAPEDLELFAALPLLREIDARECRDYTLLARLTDLYPDCRILTNVEAAGKSWDQDTTVLTVPGDTPSLPELFRTLPRLTAVRFLEPLPTEQELEALRTQFPELGFTCHVELDGRTISTSVHKLMVPGIQIDNVEEFSRKLDLFPHLELVNVQGAGLPKADRQAIEKAHPQVEFDWDVRLAGARLSVDDRLVNLDGHVAFTVEDLRMLQKALPEMEEIFLGPCGIPNERLAAYREEVKDQLKVVWTVLIGERKIPVRTDEKAFCINKKETKSFVVDETAYDLRYCNEMECLDLGHMVNLTNCDFCAYMPNLKYLILSLTNIESLKPLQNLDKLIWLEIFTVSKVKDFSPLLHLKNLQNLNICYCGANPTVIMQMTWLDQLRWHGCSYETQVQLREALPNTDCNFIGPSSTDGGWRETQNYRDMRDMLGMNYLHG